MPERVQMLYVQLGMNADDDGVVEAFTITRMVGGTEDDLRILEEKELIRILNDDLVVFILDWREHNSIRADK